MKKGFRLVLLCKKFFNKIRGIGKKFDSLMFIPKKRKTLSKALDKDSRAFITLNDSLFINQDLKERSVDINKKARNIIKEHTEPEDLIKYIKSMGTPVIKAKHMEKALALIDEKEGFICPQSGINALFLSIMINILSAKNIKIGFKTPPMFIFSKQTVNFYILAENLHHWLSFNNGLAGYDEETQKLFKEVWINRFNLKKFKKLSFQEVIAVKSVIKRNVEAIDFLREISRELIGQKHCHNKILNGQSVNI